MSYQTYLRFRKRKAEAKNDDMNDKTKTIPEQQTQAIDFRLGDRVECLVFGPGVIADISDSDGDDELVEVKYAHDRYYYKRDGSLPNAITPTLGFPGTIDAGKPVTRPPTREPEPQPGEVWKAPAGYLLMVMEDDSHVFLWHPQATTGRVYAQCAEAIRVGAYERLGTFNEVRVTLPTAAT